MLWFAIGLCIWGPTLKLPELLVALIAIDSASSGLSIMLADKEALAVRKLVYSTCVAQLVALGAAAYAMSHFSRTELPNICKFRIVWWVVTWILPPISTLTRSAWYYGISSPPGLLASFGPSPIAWRLLVSFTTPSTSLQRHRHRRRNRKAETRTSCLRNITVSSRSHSSGQLQRQ